MDQKMMAFTLFEQKQTYLPTLLCKSIDPKSQNPISSSRVDLLFDWYIKETWSDYQITAVS